MGIIELKDGVIIDHRAREWCKLPYPNHPKGCPNFGKKFTCPPQAPLIEDWLNGFQRLWLVCVTFDLQEHADIMLLRHPHWTDRQARCLLYWQPKVNSELEALTYQFYGGLNREATYCPEAMGVNVIETARRAGLPIETKPLKIVHKIALVRSTIW